MVETKKTHDSKLLYQNTTEKKNKNRKIFKLSRQSGIFFKILTGFKKKKKLDFLSLMKTEMRIRLISKDHLR